MRKIGLAAILAIALIIIPGMAQAHCDTMEGPVIGAARQALDSGNFNYVAIWVQPGSEAELRAAFDDAIKMRSGPKADRESSDMRFYEEFVRIHREGEGAPYTGIKPEGTEMEPVVIAADKAIATGSLSYLHPYVSAEIHDGVVDRYRKVMSLKDFDVDDVKSGREYVKAYVDFMHYAEGGGEGGHHHEEAELSPAPKAEPERPAALPWLLVAGLSISTLILGIAYIAKSR